LSSNGRNKKAGKAVHNIDKIVRYSGHDLKTGPLYFKTLPQDLNNGLVRFSDVQFTIKKFARNCKWRNKMDLNQKKELLVNYSEIASDYFLYLFNIY
jgi:hypothetical protein